MKLFDNLAAAAEANPAAISADASSNTFTASGVWLRGHDPKTDVTMGELLFEAQPYARLIVMLRNPADRLYSAFHYYRAMYERDKPPATAAEFDGYAARCVADWEKCVADHGKRACIRRFEPQQLIRRAMKPSGGLI